MDENKTQTTPPEFEQPTDIDEQIKDLAEQYAINRAITNIIIKKYTKLMKKKAAKIVIFILLAMIVYGCVTVNIYQRPVKKYKNYTEQDTVNIESWYYLTKINKIESY